MLIVTFRDVDMEGNLGSFGLTGKLPGVYEVRSMCPSISFIKEVRKRPWKGKNGDKRAGKYASPRAEGVKPSIDRGW